MGRVISALCLGISLLAIPRIVAAAEPGGDSRRTHKLALVSAKVGLTTASGQPWDAGVAKKYQPPDVYVLVHLTDRASEDQIDTLEKSVQRLKERQSAVDQKKGLLRQLDKTASNSPKRARIEAQLQELQTKAIELNAAEQRSLEAANRKIAEVRKKIAYRSKTVEDDYDPLFNAEVFEVKAGDELHISVRDEDVLTWETIGRHKLTVTEEMLKQSSADLKFGQVSSLKLQFRPK